MRRAATKGCLGSWALELKTSDSGMTIETDAESAQSWAEVQLDSRISIESEPWSDKRLGHVSLISTTEGIK